jgi:hypothetical protein
VPTGPDQRVMEKLSVVSRQWLMAVVIKGETTRLLQGFCCGSKNLPRGDALPITHHP